jgi:hypothetical protein
MAIKSGEHGTRALRTEAIIAAIVAWMVTGDTSERKKRQLEIQREFRLTERSFYRWAAQVRTSERQDIRQTVTDKKHALDAEWAKAIGGALAAGVKFLDRAMGPDGLDCRDPQAVHSAAGAVKILSETAMAMRMLDVRLAGQTGANAAPVRPVAAVGSVANIRRAS